MDAIIMCGGTGTRLACQTEKPLVSVAGRPMIQHVITALADSQCETTYAVASDNTPKTTKFVDVPVITTPGEGYVPDLQTALADDRISLPVFTIGADLPLVTPNSINHVLEQYNHTSLTVCVSIELKRQLGVSIDTTITKNNEFLVPTGVNIVDSDASSFYISDDERFAVNVNRPRDLQVAEVFL